MTKLAGLGLAAIVLVTVFSIASGTYCNKTIRQRYSVVVTYTNPCPYRGNYISKRLVWRTRLVPIRVCCDGWTGCYCHIPQCGNKCGINQKCVLPNTCECSSRRFVPVGGNQQCSLAECTTETNCYPGTCMPGNICSCFSGFEGSNCQTVSDTARYRKCEVTLLGTDYGGTPVKDKIDGKCFEDDIVTDVVVKPGFSRVRSLQKMEMNWEGYYHEPRDKPTLRPVYIARSDPGIVYASTNISRPGFSRIYPCYDGTDTNEASLTALCTKSQTVSMLVPHGSKYNISLYTVIGGHKEYKATDNFGEYEKQIFTGLSASVVLDVTFDSESPVHCLVDSRYECMSEDNILPPEPIFAGNDATTEPELTFYWAGWYDEPSQIKEYFYSMWELEYVNGTLVPYGPPMVRGVWTPGDPYPSLIASKPGFVSAVINVTDFAGNRNRADTLALYAPGSSLEADDSTPIKVPSAPEEGRWFNTLTVKTVNLSYTGHFVNKVFQEHKLLSPVYQHPDISSTYRDKFGNITYEGLGPTEGIKSINYTYQYLPLTSRKKRQAPTTRSASDSNLQNKVLGAPFDPQSDGDTLKIDLTVEDVMGNVVSETVRVGADSSPPLIDQASARFEENTMKKIGGLQHFTSSFVSRAYDPHSGVTRAEWVASQPGKTVQGTHHIFPLNDEQCNALGQDCICTPLRACYNANAEVLIDNCELAKLDENTAFDLEITFLNNASLATKMTMEIDPFKIEGPGKYPHVAEPAVNTTSPTEAFVNWRLPHACETFSKIKVEYNQRSTQTESQLLSRMAENTTLSGLIPQRESSVTIILVYTDGNEAKITSTFVTPSTVLKITAGQIAGASIGLIVLVLLLLILVLLLLMWVYRRKTIEEKPSLLVALEDKMETYGVLKVYRERIYQDSPYYKAQVPYPTKKVVYDGEIYDEVQEYKKMTFPTAGNTEQPKYDISNIVLGSGNLCVVKRANLRDKDGSKAVAAKLLKGGKGEQGKSLLEAKINYLSRVAKHENLVNYISADKTLPVLFLELCGMGNLLDWVKGRSKQLTTEDNDKMLGFSQDITAGLRHLHNNSIIHRRLAAHNVLLASGTDRPIAKITGFGPLANDLNQQDKKLPARWMAPELLGNPPPGQTRPYSTHSDMWSWGVTLWEMFSLGEKPYEKVPIEQLKQRLAGGERLPQPQYCADTVYEQLMKPCWQLNPSDRSSADHVYARLDTFINGSHTNHGYYDEEVTQTLDDDHILENEQNRERIYSNQPEVLDYHDPQQ